MCYVVHPLNRWHSLTESAHLWYHQEWFTSTTATTTGFFRITNTSNTAATTQRALEHLAVWEWAGCPCIASPGSRVTPLSRERDSSYSHGHMLLRSCIVSSGAARFLFFFWPVALQLGLCVSQMSVCVVPSDWGDHFLCEPTPKRRKQSQITISYTFAWTWQF